MGTDANEAAGMVTNIRSFKVHLSVSYCFLMKLIALGIECPFIWSRGGRLCCASLCILWQEGHIILQNLNKQIIFMHGIPCSNLKNVLFYCMQDIWTINTWFVHNKGYPRISVDDITTRENLGFLMSSMLWR